MDRLLVLRLESVGIAAEAVFNGVPLLRTAAAAAAPVAPVTGGPEDGGEDGTAAVAASAQVLSLSVNEFAVAGGNTLELRVQPPPPGQPPETEPWLSDGQRGACLRLLLPRMGQRAHPETARTLAQLDWAPVAGQVVELPALVAKSVDLPINFARWRWLDAPVVADIGALQAAAASFVQTLALGLARGDAEPLVQASRLRLEELAQAYQLNLADAVGRLRLRVQQLHAAQPLRPPMPKPSTLVLRAVADGRLLECLTPAGQPALHSVVAGGGSMTWPLRLAHIEGRFYVLR